jgi:hypothetical protein
LGSNFIAEVLGALLVVVGVKGTFLTFALAGLYMIADKRQDYWDESPRNHKQIAVENTHQLKKGVVARHDLA